LRQQQVSEDYAGCQLVIGLLLLVKLLFQLPQVFFCTCRLAGLYGKPR
jgi:hypothetical protein